MRVKLKVLKGSKAGKLLPLSGYRMVIGRDESCDLRPNTDLVSRQHCVITVTDSQVMIKDLGSRNGTYVNGARIEGELGLKAGDHLKIGPVELEVAIDTKTKEKRPEVANVAEVVQRTAEESVGDFDIGSWLEEVDEDERKKRFTDPGSRQFTLNKSDKITAQETIDITGNTTINEKNPEEKTDKENKENPKFGKLPISSKPKAKDSREAAQDMLKKFFAKG